MPVACVCAVAQRDAITAETCLGKRSHRDAVPAAQVRAHAVAVQPASPFTLMPRPAHGPALRPASLSFCTAFCKCPTCSRLCAVVRCKLGTLRDTLRAHVVACGHRCLRKAIFWSEVLECTGVATSPFYRISIILTSGRFYRLTTLYPLHSG